jgi:hypothetical protein
VAVRSAAIQYLLTQQQTNGSWNDDPYSTALALAVARPLSACPVRRLFDMITPSEPYDWRECP